MSEDRETERERLLPEHETDADTGGVGGGLMSSGGTAVDRGTGELSGPGQGGGDDDEPSEGLVDDIGTPGVVTAGPPGGGATPYIAGYVEDRDQDGDRADKD
ncbi:MAG TPA: hypothetical protein VKA85_07075 [Candidatus Limnocylindrales bacterium]|nr:hypothetical protein [Candidatus Limnocylindrales bacterium]